MRWSALSRCGVVDRSAGSGVTDRHGLCRAIGSCARAERRRGNNRAADGVRRRSDCAVGVTGLHGEGLYGLAGRTVIALE